MSLLTNRYFKLDTQLGNDRCEPLVPSMPPILFLCNRTSMQANHRPVGTVGPEIQSKIDRIELPKGVYITAAGDVKNQTEAFTSLLRAASTGAAGLPDHACLI